MFHRGKNICRLCNLLDRLKKNRQASYCLSKMFHAANYISYCLIMAAMWAECDTSDLSPQIFLTQSFNMKEILSFFFLWPKPACIFGESSLSTFYDKAG